jgi:hypothetical protein
MPGLAYNTKPGPECAQRVLASGFAMPEIAAYYGQTGKQANTYKLQAATPWVTDARSALISQIRCKGISSVVGRHNPELRVAFREEPGDHGALPMPNAKRDTDSSRSYF